jgi:diacylglycerol kinase
MKKFLMSFVYAIKGIGAVFYKNRNITIQLIIAIAVIAFSIAAKINITDLVIIIMVSFIVIILEAVNTAIERMIDIISPKHHAGYGKIKDIMAGAVLMASVMAVIIGVLILWQPFIGMVLRFHRP